MPLNRGAYASAPSARVHSPHADRLGIKSRLGFTALFDTTIHQGTRAIDRYSDEVTGKLFGVPRTGVDEKDWIKRFVEVRHVYLQSHTNAVVRGTTYRTQALLDLIMAGNWELEAPLRVRGFVMVN